LKKKSFYAMTVLHPEHEPRREETAMDTEKLIYSVIPLVLIIFFSWLFSVMGSRMKKQAEEESPGVAKSPGDQLLDLFGKVDDEKIVVSDERGTPGQTGGIPGSWSSEWGMYRDPQAPRVSPKPITPKWWGA